jgi:ATP-binding cassette subfamily C (CFTR/MRP) protein 1
MHFKFVLYTEADIYLFDDPLAAIDPAIAKRIFKECISNEGSLNNKTRLLVTHQIQFLPEFHHCILLDRLMRKKL